MAFFSYKASNENGRIIKGKKTADTPADLIEELRQDNLYCTEYELLRNKQPKAKYKFKTKKLAIFCRQLSAMLLSGVNLVRAIHILTTQEQNLKAKNVLMEIYEELQRGNSFSDTLTRKSGAFPNLFISMVAAGEASGNLDVIMDRVSNHYSNEAKIKNSITNAMIYPCMLVCGLIGIIIIMFVKLIPLFRDLFGDSADTPAITKMLLGTSDFIIQKWYILIAAILLLILLIVALRKIPSIRLWGDKQKCTFPKVGDLVVTIYTARFARTMSNLFSSGLQMVESIEKTVDTIGNRYVSLKFADVIKDVKRGESLSASVAKAGIFENLFVSSIYIGEESGRLDEVLQKNADYYDEESKSAIKKLVSLIEPVIIIVIGVFVAFVLSGIFTSMMSMYGEVGK